MVVEEDLLLEIFLASSHGKGRSMLGGGGGGSGNPRGHGGQGGAGIVIVRYPE